MQLLSESSVCIKCQNSYVKLTIASVIVDLDSSSQRPRPPQNEDHTKENKEAGQTVPNFENNDSEAVVVHLQLVKNNKVVVAVLAACSLRLAAAAHYWRTRMDALLRLEKQLPPASLLCHSLLVW